MQNFSRQLPSSLSKYASISAYFTAIRFTTELIALICFFLFLKPMDLGFTNIGDEQSIDNIDLNNITPSIKLASSVSSGAVAFDVIINPQNSF